MNSYYRSFAALLTTCVFLSVAYTACVKNNCVGVLCANNGVCVDGICACPYGYEGADCGTEWIDKFSGNWNGETGFLNDATGSKYNYEVQVSGVKDSFYVYGLADTMPAFKCKISSRFEFGIPTQVLDSHFTINNGRGTLDSNTMIVSGTINFRLRDTLDMVKRDTTMTTRFTWKR